MPLYHVTTIMYVDTSTSVAPLENALTQRLGKYSNASKKRLPLRI
jgi:hypothetical protein